MNSNRKSATIVGACFLISNVVFLLGAMAFIEPILGEPDYLTLASANRAKVVIGVLLELINAIAYLGIAVFMFPIFKGRFESLALGYVGFRVIEFVMQILSGLGPLKLLTLSDEFVGAGASAASSYQAAGTTLLAERTGAFQMVAITLVLGAFLFYSMLYRTKLIPRFISIWGLIGAAGVLVNTVVDMLGLSMFNMGVLMLLNEVFLGVWLIVKGFEPSAILSEPVQEDKN